MNHLCLFTYANCLLYVIFLWILNIYICLLIKINVNETGETDHLCLFTYANPLLITCGFRLKIYNVFVYLFKFTSTTAAQVTTFVYLLVQIGCWLKHFDMFVYSSKNHFPFNNKNILCWLLEIWTLTNIWSQLSVNTSQKSSVSMVP